MAVSSRLKGYLTLMFLSVIWGTSFILIKKSLTVYDPEEVAILRVGISGLAFTPFFSILRNMSGVDGPYMWL